MDPVALFDRLAKEWPVITSAPGSIAIIFVIAVTLGWLITRYIFKAQIDARDATIRTQEERIDLANDRINQAKDKSDEAERVRSQLEKQLAENKWQLDEIKTLAYQGVSPDPKFMELAVSSSAAATDSFFTLKRLDDEISEQLQPIRTQLQPIDGAAWDEHFKSKE